MKKKVIDLDDPNLSDADREIKQGITYSRKLPSDSKLVIALQRMIIRKNLKQDFYSRKITLEELNRKLHEAGIDSQYYFDSKFLRIVEESLV